MARTFNSKAVCLDLLAADSEEAVQEIIDSLPEMREGRNWRPLDRRETNFNITSNQASDGGKALTELMTNMVDAVLLKCAHQKVIDPRGKSAPKTMYEAVDKLIKPLRGGKLVNLDPADPWLRDFAQKNLVIGVTGAKSARTGLPCYTFVDNGEGQRPEDFERTFLSLSEGNKRNILFVQGKYNMGSSGVLGYCGLKWFKLIVSRRYDGKSAWGFTLMRKRPGGGMPIAEYFLLDGKIPAFEDDVLYPFFKQDGKRYDGVHLTTGTVIKLFDYQIGSRFSSGFRGSREAFNENLVETILPFRLLDFRQKPDPKRGGDRAEGIDPRPFYGMEFLLIRSHREDEKDEEEDEAVGTGKIAVSNIDDPQLGHIVISAIKLKRSLPTWLGKSHNRVFHAVNGQVQFKQSRGYLSQSCKLPALKDRVVIIVDASALSFETHNDVWKGDREHVRDTMVGERYKEVVTEEIEKSEALKKFQNDVALEELAQAAKTERNELFQKLVDADPNLAALLTDRDPIINLPSAGGGKGGDDSGAGRFDGKYSPTFVRLEGKNTEINIPINRTRPISARTDVENGYLQRADNKGRLLVDDKIRERFGIRSHLHDGRLVVFFDPIDGIAQIGDKFTLKIGLQDDSMPQAVQTEAVTICVVEKEKPQPKPDKPPVKPQQAGEKGKTEGTGKRAPTHGLPKHVLLTNDGRKLGNQDTEIWPEGFTEHDGGTIKDLGEQGMLYKINYDNTYHLKYRLNQRGDIARDVVTEKYILGMRILMLGYEHAVRAGKQSMNGKGEELAEFIDDFRRFAARGAASTVLALAENLPRIVDKASVTASQDVE